jgi:malic enzyme
VAIAEVVSDEELNPAFIIPGVFDTRVAEAVAEAVRTEAQRHLAEQDGASSDGAGRVDHPADPAGGAATSAVVGTAR